MVLEKLDAASVAVACVVFQSWSAFARMDWVEQAASLRTVAFHDRQYQDVNFNFFTHIAVLEVRLRFPPPDREKLVRREVH